MIYFRKDKETIEKYRINFKKEKIEQLKQAIIENCSFIKHKEYESDHFPIFTNEIIKNFKAIPTKKKVSYFEEEKDVYLYCYDEYKTPYLVELINQLLSENPKAIDEILSYDSTLELIKEDKIDLLNKELYEIDPEDINEKKEKLKELEELLKRKKLNKENQSKINLYYFQLIKLLKFTLIDSLTIKEISTIESFLEISDYTNKTLIKTLKNNE